MEVCHRKIILDNLEKLINTTEYGPLVKKSVERGLISDIMKTNIENILEKNELERHRKLIIKITKRGPDAYNLFVDICKELDYYQAAKILRSGEHSGVFISINSDKENRTAEIHDYMSNSNKPKDNFIQTQDKTPKLEIFVRETKHTLSTAVKKSKKIHYDSKIGQYPMRTKYRGVFFMVNIVEFPENIENRRNGATVDRDNLVHLFREFGFDVFYYEDLTSKQFHKLLDELLDSHYVKRTECFVMALMTHGDMEPGVEFVEFHDGAVEILDNILDKFKNDACRNLVGKPKIFFFPFCRGSLSDRGTYAKSYPKKVETDGIHTKLPINLPTYSDMLICYATVPGFRTHRDPDKGSWFVQTLCEIWAEHAHDTHIEDLQKMVGDKTGQIRTTDSRLQTASRTDYGFNKKLYFNPGFYES